MLSGDCNYASDPNNADLNDNDVNVIYGQPSPTHNNRVNVLYADWHVSHAKNFVPGEMTFSLVNPGINVASAVSRLILRRFQGNGAVVIKMALADAEEILPGVDAADFIKELFRRQERPRR